MVQIDSSGSRGCRASPCEGQLCMLLKVHAMAVRSRLWWIRLFSSSRLLLIVKPFISSCNRAPAHLGHQLAGKSASSFSGLRASGLAGSYGANAQPNTVLRISRQECSRHTVSAVNDLISARKTLICKLPHGRWIGKCSTVQLLLLQ